MISRESFLEFIRNDDCLETLKYDDKIEAILELASFSDFFTTDIMHAIEEYEDQL